MMAKQNLILIPGLLCDASVWSHQIDVLSPYATITIPNLSTADSPEKMVTTILQDAPDSFALAGHSMGGWVALEIMKTASNRVTKLGLLNTTAKPDTEEKANARRNMIEQARKNNYNDIIDHLAQLFVYRKEKLTDIIPMLTKNKASLIPHETAMLARGDCEKVLSKISCPTLVIHSEHDAVFDLDNSLQLSQAIKSANLVLIKEAGHMSLLEQPNRVNEALLSWLVPGVVA